MKRGFLVEDNTRIKQSRLGEIGSLLTEIKAAGSGVESRLAKIELLLNTFSSYGPAAVEKVESRIRTGTDIKVRGVEFDAQVVSEALQMWQAERGLEAVHRKADLAIEAAFHITTSESEAKLESIGTELSALCSQGGAVSESQKLHLAAARNAERRVACASAARHKAQETCQASATAAKKATVAHKEAAARNVVCANEIKQLEKRLQTLRSEQERTSSEIGHLLEQIGTEREREAASAAEGVEHDATVKSAATEAAQMQALISRLQSKSDAAKGALTKLDQTIVQHLAQTESQFLSWTAGDVYGWLKRLEAGRFAVHSKSFRDAGVAGKMLPGLAPTDLVSLGVADVGDRRALLDIVGRLRLQAVAEGSSEPPSELVCPITQEVVQDPVAIAGDEQGHAYERIAIERWLADGNSTVPLTGVRLGSAADRQLLPLRALARQAHEWRRAHP